VAIFGPDLGSDRGLIAMADDWILLTIAPGDIWGFHRRNKPIRVQATRIAARPPPDRPPPARPPA